MIVRVDGGDFAKHLAGVEANRFRQRQKLDHIDPALVALDIRHIRLWPTQALCNDCLR